MITEEEKDLLNQLLTINPDNIWKLVEQKFNFQLTTYEGPNYTGPSYTLQTNDLVYKITIEGEKDVFSYVSFIESFLLKMKKYGYLNIEETSNHDKSYIFIYKDNATNIIAFRMISLMNKYKNLKVTLYDTLQTFIENNYKTDSEIESNLTRKIAFISLIISILAIIVPTITSIFTTWYTNKNNTNERVVTLDTSELEKLPIEIINKLEIDKNSFEKIPVEVQIKVIHEYPQKEETPKHEN